MAGEAIGFWSTELRDRISATANGKQRAKLEAGPVHKPSKPNPSVTYFLQLGSPNSATSCRPSALLTVEVFQILDFLWIWKYLCIH